MHYPDFKIEMFRLVDVLPVLRDVDSVSEHIKQYLLRDELKFPSVIRAGLGLATSNALTSKFAAASIRKNVEGMARGFITGQDAASAQKTLRRLWDQGTCFTVDILGEAAITENEALHYQQKYLNLVKELPGEVKAWPANVKIEASPLGPIPRANVSVKCSSLYSQIDVLAFEHSKTVIKDRLRPIFKQAVQLGVFVNLDMEQNDFRDLFFAVAEDLFMEDEFRAYPHLGIVVQAYLKSSLADVDRMIALARRRGSPFTIRLVKGAYWDSEVIAAMRNNVEPPVFLEKAATDANYEVCARRLLDHYPVILAAFGSHNVRNLAFVMACAEELKLDPRSFEIQMLFGMAEPFKKALVSLGYRLREYAPVGDLLPGMAYLVRRLLENTSNEGFLRASFVDKKSVDSLLVDPRERVRGLDSRTLKEKQIMFANESFQDFAVESARKNVFEAVEKVSRKLPIECKAVIGGKLVENLKFEDVFCPSDLKTKVSRFALCGKAEADRALEIASQSKWKEQSVAYRCGVLRKAAQKMREAKAELTAIMVLEVAKSYREADADVCEAIDFCEYYAQEMERLSKGLDTSAGPGEATSYRYTARGVTVAIAPWNFPLAILCGMTVGPLVAGCPVVMKPAEQSSGIAAKLFDILMDAGVDPTAVHLLPGLGEDVGAALVASPLTHIVNFTGSRSVGLHLLSACAQVAPGQRHIKRVVAEMGGKNALIIDEDADLDEAVMGALHSAFGFQGQKCSALSRLLVHEKCFDVFKSRFLEAMKSLKIGTPKDPSFKVGPVIDREARSRLMGVIERNKSAIIGQLSLPDALINEGHYVPPTVFESSDPKSELGQVEFFGPLVTLFKVKDFSDAARVFNDVDYALTGGIYSRSPRNLERAKNELECGNLYINRSVTGALVYRHPFGGYKLSGVGAKAGGPDYLLQFLEPRSVAENTMRRGFAPEIK